MDLKNTINRITGVDNTAVRSGTQARPYERKIR